MQFLKRHEEHIVNEDGQIVKLKGLNFGGWLMLEGYILGGRNISATDFEQKFVEINGREELDDFYTSFSENYISRFDFENIKNHGFNCVRIPFHYKIVNSDLLQYLDTAVNICQEIGLYCILDMHAVPGSQNADWHSDSTGEACFWKDAKYQEHYFSLWDILSKRYKDQTCIAAYNIMNEPVIWDKEDLSKLRRIYKNCADVIRKNDTKHMLMIEGNLWSTDIEIIGEPFEDNLLYSVHFYEPLDFTFNFNTEQTYPSEIKGEIWNKDKISECLSRYRKLMDKWKIPVLVGEFGINFRKDASGELTWLNDCLEVFEDYNMHWTYWTYKTIVMNMFPDGVYRYTSNDEWILRHMPVHGWELWADLWKIRKKDIIMSLKTENFSLNTAVLEVLKNNNK